MKKIRSYFPNLETYKATIPLGELKAIKLSREEAIVFSTEEAKTFEDLLKKYGANNRLTPGEYYNGYLAIFYWWGHIEIVLMRGKIRCLTPLPPGSSKFSQKIHNLKWECVKEGSRPGEFNYSWIVRDSCFAKQISNEQERGNSKYAELDAVAIDKSLKEKIVTTLLKDKAIELTDEEDMVLKEYLGEYYSKFFIEVT